MGWAHGINAEGREVGYGVQATCDQEGCTAEIDRGLSFACGGMHDGGEHGCGKYFCVDHLHYCGAPHPLCAACVEEYEKTHPDEDDEDEA